MQGFIKHIGPKTNYMLHWLNILRSGGRPFVCHLSPHVFVFKCLISSIYKDTRTKWLATRTFMRKWFQNLRLWLWIGENKPNIIIYVLAHSKLSYCAYWRSWLLIHVTVGRVNFCQKHPNISAESFYCVFWWTDQPQKISAW